mmetsp:Transcript_34050/g.61161  ORF Transcript_34050/g.61161 Transcript_34050/m.61161 type:complete len:996 (+) Transcript_34050:108-3095(+)
MVFIPVLLALLAAVDVSSNTSCAHHTRRKGAHFPTNSPLLAFQSYGMSHRGSRGRRYDPLLLPDQRNHMAARIERNSELITSDSPDDTEIFSSPKSTPSISQCTSIISNSSTSRYPIETSRRSALLQILSLSIISTSLPDYASASEIDTTGELFTPKNEMIKGGGSAAARGIPLKPMEEKASRSRKNKSLLKGTGLIQDFYETRFITYLARFLLVFDPAASAWWKKNSKSNVAIDDESNMDSSVNNDIATEKFAEFAESVEVGLADYFLGPYGSYASVAAAKAGIAAAAPAKSASGPAKDVSLWNMIFPDGPGTQSKKQPGSISSLAKRKSKNAEKEELNLARKGILNLFSLLKARYTSVEEKQQLAILFSFISNPELQPVQEIRGLLGELDNGTIAEIELVDLSDDDDEENAASARDFFRLSSRQGGGFSKNDMQVIRVEPPAPLGDEYKPAKIRAVMKPTTRILRINVIDGGQGYTVAPDVIIKESGVARSCEAIAIVDRNGSVSEIIVLDPGFGYGGRKDRQGEPTLPTVEIRERKLLRKNISKKEVKPAKVVPELEYKVVGVNIIDGGSGYLFDQPPNVSVDLPQVDPDWFATPTILSQSIEEDEENQLILASVTQMKSGTNGVVVDTRAVRRGKDSLTLGDDTLRSIQKDPIALLPTITRPQFSKFINDASPNVIENGYYSIMSLPPVPSGMTLPPPSSSYRSIDPLFGGIGKAPVTKNALKLSSSQYLRLALSGAICTVLVRTALNPLELVKTKIQLGNDEEIIQFAMKKVVSKETDPQPSSTSKPGATQVIQSLVEVRGPLSLFQSADITFITSIVFGLFGFGATELFRRSFSAVFFDEAAAGPNEFLFLAAAGLATLLTCAAGAPFEILRVRSMSTTENLGVKTVFGEFVDQNRLKRGMPVASASSPSAITPGLQLEDITPLWSSFNPIVSRELPFAVIKFLVFDLAAGSIAGLVNSANLLVDPLVVGVGTLGLLLSAFAGALAGRF